jgi:endonuclease-3
MSIRVESVVAKRARVARVVRALTRAIPDARCALDHGNAWELLVATILSAQCTDERVNLVTPALFRAFPNAESMARGNPARIETLIRSTGFFRAKSRSLLGCARALVGRHGGLVPRTIGQLVALPGVGRKTANVVLGTAFGIPSGIVVDTHVIRIAGRLGLTREKDPVKIERDLMAVVPESSWIAFSHLVIHHGRRTCFARKPRCPHCPVRELCPSAGKV